MKDKQTKNLFFEPNNGHPNRIQSLISKCRQLLTLYNSVTIYLIFGVLTTIVDFSIRFILYGTSLNYHIVNIIGWIAAVTFAFITNRRFVFHSNCYRLILIFKEYISFSGTRLFSLAIQELLYEVGVSCLNIGEKMLMIPVSILVVVLNYFLGRLVFTKNANPR